MNEQAKAMRREYKKAWNRRNPDKVKAAQQRYWERKAAAAAIQEIKPMEERNCDDCRFCNKTELEEPCCHCSHSHVDLFKPKEDEVIVT